MTAFDTLFDTAELDELAQLDSPPRIQAFLDAIPYSTEERYRCPRSVLRDRCAHCFDGAVFAAAALYRLGEPPLILDMVSDNDDEHMLAVFKRHGHWGAVAKSNFVGLRYREPIHRGLRELVMTYFEVFFNTAYQKTLRGYTRPLDLRSFGDARWLVEDAVMDTIARRTDQLARIMLLTPQMIQDLSPVDERSYHAGLAGADPAGLFTPASGE